MKKCGCKTKGVNPMGCGGKVSAASGIHIKPENKGKFTATKKATGKSTEELTHSKNPVTRKRAIFAQNAKKWKHAYGGEVNINEKSFGGILVSAGSGAAAGALGASPGGPIGAGAGAIIGGAVGLVKGIFSHVAEKRAAKEQEERDKLSLARNAQVATAGTISGGGKLTSATGTELNPFNMSAYGGFNPNKNITEYKTGGSHEQNPNGGIQIGIGLNGKPNTVEEGETSILIDPGNGKKIPMIFSNRIEYKKVDSIPGTFRGKTIAAVSKSIERAFEGRNDKYSERTKQSLLLDLAAYQEQTKQEMGIDKGPDQNQYKYAGFVNPADPFKTLQEKSSAVLDISKQQNTLDSITGANTKDIMSGSTGATRDMNWLQRNENAIQSGALGLGYASQAVGVISNIMERNRMKKPAPIAAQTVNADSITPNLVNRQNILREITESQQTATQNLKASAGNFGAYAANAAGIQNATARGIGTTMLQASEMDAQEMARVQQGKVGIQQFNAQMMAKADEANEQNEAAYSAQRSAYNQAIAGNIGSIGQSLVNYVTGSRYAKEAGNADIMSSFSAFLNRRKD